MTFINAYALYSTHSHIAGEDAPAAHHPAVPHRHAGRVCGHRPPRRRRPDAFARFDPTTFEPARLMYWPSTPEDGEYLFRYTDQPFLDPDEVLATYADWQDASLWPTTQPVEAKMRRSVSSRKTR